MLLRHSYGHRLTFNIEVKRVLGQEFSKIVLAKLTHLMNHLWSPRQLKDEGDEEDEQDNKPDIRSVQLLLGGMVAHFPDNALGRYKFGIVGRVTDLGRGPNFNSWELRSSSSKTHRLGASLLLFQRDISPTSQVKPPIPTLLAVTAQSSLCPQSRCRQ